MCLKKTGISLLISFYYFKRIYKNRLVFSVVLNDTLNNHKSIIANFKPIQHISPMRFLVIAAQLINLFKESRNTMFAMHFLDVTCGNPGINPC